MKAKIIALFLLAGSSLFARTHFAFGVGFGGGYYPPAPAVGYYAPPPPVPVYTRPYCPGPGYVWVNGYWYPSGPRYAWHAGYWGRPPYAGAYWVAPRYYGHRYYSGYWRGRR